LFLQADLEAIQQAHFALLPFLTASSRHAAAKSANRFFVSGFHVIGVVPPTDETEPAQQFSFSWRAWRLHGGCWR
jgi:hypothetical protein